VKQMQPDVWDSFFVKHRIGDIVHGKILRVANFGAFVEIAEASKACAITRSRRSEWTADAPRTGAEFDSRSSR